MNERKYHYIYRIDRFDGKYYIGMHSCDSPEDGYMGRGLKIRRSIEKYGKDKHYKTILEYCKDRKSLRKREMEIVNAELLKDINCLNLCEGGEGGAGFRKNHVLVKSKKTGEYLSVDRENFQQNREQYYATNEGLSPVINLKTGKKRLIPSEYIDDAEFSHVCKGKILVQGDLGNKWISRTEFETGKYHGINHGKISGDENPMAKTICIYDQFGSLRYTCRGNFEQTCLENRLPFSLLKMSYLKSGIPIIRTNRQLKNAERRGYLAFIGWFARIS